mmetsp:Transcript_46630/g.101321  ORF Transcript_46630/g.101321 Transcript_46630/m.101321 type:complete len:624 (+) Transcript_46630:116-1987(+)|eukprot:CAMPEP_0204265438 /NCGR_PEP_ID=MMETSP0468-20130131/9666_1 /ASSEMBLY_ACC=CAM_ASM_000383 /TAXON_ID=2969 /ORGANISM="Oxyrrhis marina" /LENGTH=623 /DNA_ID=CAMNT_0051240385 /DNA_START=98 /DNA_END=1969 /DNA_ORIENTATION=+
MRLTGFLAVQAAAAGLVADPKCSKLSNLQNTVGNLRAALKAESRDAKNAQDVKADSCRTIKKEQRATIEAAEKELKHLEEEKKAADDSVVDVKQKLKSSKAEIVDIDKEILAVSNKITGISQDFNKAQKKVGEEQAEVNREISQARKDLAAGTNLSQLDRLAADDKKLGEPDSFIQLQAPSEVDQLQEKLDDLKKKEMQQEADFNKAHQDLQDELKAAQERKNTVQGNVARYNKLLAAKEDKVASVSRDQNAAERTVKLTEKLMQSTEAECTQVLEAADVAAEDYKNLLERYATAEQDLSQLVGADLLQVQPSAAPVPEFLEVARATKAFPLIMDQVESSSGMDLAEGAVQASSGIDPMANVKRMIEGFISALKAKDAGEAGLKDWCSSEKEKNLREERENADTIDQLKAEVRSRKAENQQLKASLKLMQEEIGAMLEEENRVTEEILASKTRFKTVLSNHDMMEKILAKVVDTLRRCLDVPGGAFLQQAATGAPELIQLLKSISEDTVKMRNRAVEAQEARLVIVEDLEKATKAAVKSRKKEIQDTRVAIAENVNGMSEARDSMKGKEIESQQVVAFMSTLNQQCGPATKNTFEEVQRRRQEEIDSLQNALAVLSGEELPDL